MEFEIVEAKRWMCGRLARALRVEHQRAAERIGQSVHHSLTDVYRQSYYKKAALIDGQVAAMWGATGSPLSPAAFAWVAMTDQMALHPRLIVKVARSEHAAIMSTKQELVTTIIDGDEAAKRFAVFMGWHAADEGEGAPAETRYGRRRLTDFIDREASLRIPAGGGNAIKLGYHTIDGRLPSAS